MASDKLKSSEDGPSQGGESGTRRLFISVTSEALRFRILSLIKHMLLNVSRSEALRCPLCVCVCGGSACVWYVLYVCVYVCTVCVCMCVCVCVCCPQDDDVKLLPGEDCSSSTLLRMCSPACCTHTVTRCGLLNCFG